MEQDYTMTIRAFFASVYEYANKMKSLYEKPEEKKSIAETISKIKGVEKMVLQLIKERTTKPYDARILGDLAYKLKTEDYTYMAFVKPKSVDNSALIAYREVLNGIGDYYGLPIQQHEKLLRPIKHWKYITATSLIEKVKNKISPLSNFVMKDYTK
ncbi:MAG: hypothetical protein IKO56_07580 [Alphaproteobacteria bacterium]|nr:hypothetical protein [Alphaproteobacteria bacterium]